MDSENFLAHVTRLLNSLRSTNSSDSNHRLFIIDSLIVLKSCLDHPWESLSLVAVDLLYEVIFSDSFSNLFLERGTSNSAENVNTSIAQFQPYQACMQDLKHNRDRYKKNFEQLDTVGQGSYGIVCKVKERISKTVFAVKRICFTYNTVFQYNEILKEAENLSKLDHRNIVKYNSAWIELPYAPDGQSEVDWDSSQRIRWPNTNSLRCDRPSFYEVPIPNCRGVPVMLYIQMEYCDSNLNCWLIKRNKREELPFYLEEMKIFTDIFHGLLYLHSKNIAHKDLAPRNVFYSKAANSMKIGDFGESSWKRCGNGLNEYSPGNSPSSALELKEDILKLGEILIQLLNNFSRNNECENAIDEIRRGRFPTAMKDNWPNLIPLVQNLIKENYTERWNVENIEKFLSEQNSEQKEVRILEKEVEKLKQKLAEAEKKLDEERTSNRCEIDRLKQKLEETTRPPAPVQNSRSRPSNTQVPIREKYDATPPPREKYVVTPPPPPEEKYDASLLPRGKYEIAPRFLKLQSQKRNPSPPPPPPQEFISSPTHAFPPQPTHVPEEVHDIIPPSRPSVRSLPSRPQRIDNSRVAQLGSLESARTAKDYVEVYSKMENMPIKYSTLQFGQIAKTKGYVTTLALGDKKYQSYPILKPTKEEAEELVASKAMAAIKERMKGNYSNGVQARRRLHLSQDNKLIIQIRR